MDTTKEHETANANTCCFCGAELGDIGGSSPEPAYIADDGAKCCADCNCHIVIPARAYIAKLISERKAELC